jgi:pimeloyl-ACP methyl ester carboxylesterase
MEEAAMAEPVAWAPSRVDLGGLAVEVRRAGKGPPLLILHHDSGTPEQLPLYATLAQRFDVILPQHPGFGHSERPVWMRSARDLAVLYRWLLTALDVPRAALLGLGFGGWLAAEMASMAPDAAAKVTLVGPMGIKPAEGFILDQALVSHIDYARAGFHDQKAFAAVYGDEPSTDQLVEWDLCREMCFRIAWKPYMWSHSLPHLLGGVQSPTTIVWGAEDKVVPVPTAQQWRAAMPKAKLEMVAGCGHCVDMENPAALAALV